MSDKMTRDDWAKSNIASIWDRKWVAAGFFQWVNPLIMELGADVEGIAIILLISLSVWFSLNICLYSTLPLKSHLSQENPNKRQAEWTHGLSDQKASFAIFFCSEAISKIKLKKQSRCNCQLKTIYSPIWAPVMKKKKKHTQTSRP